MIQTHPLRQQARMMQRGGSRACSKKAHDATKKNEDEAFLIPSVIQGNLRRIVFVLSSWAGNPSETKGSGCGKTHSHFPRNFVIVPFGTKLESEGRE